MISKLCNVHEDDAIEVLVEDASRRRIPPISTDIEYLDEHLLRVACISAAARDVDSAAASRLVKRVRLFLADEFSQAALAHPSLAAKQHADRGRGGGDIAHQ